MWTEQETKRYEEHLEKHWTRDGRQIKSNPALEQYKSQIETLENAQWRQAIAQIFG